METEILFRVCKTCGINKELETGYWKHSRKTGVYRVVCIECLREKATAYYYKNKDKVNERVNRNKEKNKERFYAGLVEIPEIKKCSACDVIKVSDSFFKNATLKSGLSSVCKDCMKEYRIDHQKKNRERITKQSAKYVEDHLDDVIAYRKRYYEEHKEEYKVRDRERKQRCRNDPEIAAIIRAKDREYRRKRLSDPKVREHNKSLVRARYWKNKEDPEKRLIATLRRRLYEALMGISHVASIIELLGCSPEVARKFLETRFYPNPETGKAMTWENYGRPEGEEGWEIDHIFPVSFFDFSESEQQREAFHVSNLQPLWRKTNQAKHSSVPKDITLDGLMLIWKDFLNGGLTFRLYGLP